MKEVNDVLALHGYFLAVSVSTGIASDESHYLIQEDRVDGLILLSPMEEDNYIVELKRRNIPYVLIDNQKPENDAFSVTVDNYRGGYSAAKHLIALGHSSIAHLSGNEMFRSTRERRSGFEQALNEHGLIPFETIQGEFEISFGYESCRKWLSSGSLPTAVFAGDDYIALGVVNALLEEGIRVPEQVAVVGYDGQDISSQLHPYLTTIRQPADRIGLAAVDMLLKRIDGTMKRGSSLRLDPELIIRESTVKEQPSHH